MLCCTAALPKMLCCTEALLKMLCCTAALSKILCCTQHFSECQKAIRLWWRNNIPTRQTAFWDPAVCLEQYYHPMGNNPNIMFSHSHIWEPAFTYCSHMWYCMIWLWIVRVCIVIQFLKKNLVSSVHNNSQMQTLSIIRIYCMDILKTFVTSVFLIMHTQNTT